MNLLELLHWLQKEGAPPRVIEELERKIETRVLRIERHEQEIRRFIEERQKAEDEHAKTPDLLLILLLLLLLEGDREDDEFGLADLLRVAPPPRRELADPTGFLDELDEERIELARPRW